MIEEQEMRIKEQNYELQEIQKASVQFAAFLKHNAITPYNDAMLDYLEYLISVEKEKIKVGGTDKMLQEMESSRASYMQQVKILDEAMDGGENKDILKPQGVDEFVQIEKLW
ncbi:uncharacterized protein LOC110858881 [Folsomia candida]|uniref:uncharacterized protein LOC110858881 n=1 Tax=Folsomia candida TaxID=158441 RepID=UPI000B90129F|nr:uncharacterized protein LOC110858881 [Folsomia candida]